MSRSVAISVLAGEILLLSSAAHTQSGDALIEAQRQTITDIVRPKKCPPVVDPNEIVICAQRHERHRISPSPPEPGSKEAKSVSRERNSLLDYDSGGIGSCSAVGPGGGAGCLKRKLDNIRD